MDISSVGNAVVCVAVPERDMRAPLMRRPLDAFLIFFFVIYVFVCIFIDVAAVLGLWLQTPQPCVHQSHHNPTCVCACVLLWRCAWCWRQKEERKRGVPCRMFACVCVCLCVRREECVYDLLVLCVHERHSRRNTHTHRHSPHTSQDLFPLHTWI